jgi:hypothetical protein
MLPLGMAGLVWYGQRWKYFKAACSWAVAGWWGFEAVSSLDRRPIRSFFWAVMCIFYAYNGFWELQKLRTLPATSGELAVDGPVDQKPGVGGADS